MSDPIVIVELGSNGGTLNLQTWNEVREIFQEQQQAWSWLTNVQSQDPVNMTSIVNGMLNRFQQMITRAQTEGQPVHVASGILNSIFNPPNFSETLIHSDSQLGEQIIQINQDMGHDAAAYAYAFALNRINLGQINGIERFKAIARLIIPNLNLADEMASRFEQERVKYRDRARGVIAQVTKAEEERIVQAAVNARKQSRVIRRSALEIGKRYKRSGTHLLTTQMRAIDDIRAVENGYREFMRLKAPVEYWRDKATNHLANEQTARFNLSAYFTITISVIGLVFYLIADFLLDRTGKEIPSSVYFLIASGLLTLTGLALWIGRLMTKLYLSELHLRVDAEERSVMTQAYLALSTDGELKEADRTVILGTLFKQASDGLVKDDGAPDINLANLLSKFGLK